MKRISAKTYAPPSTKKYEFIIEGSLMQGSGSNESYDEKDDLSDFWDDDYWG